MLVAPFLIENVCKSRIGHLIYHQLYSESGSSTSDEVSLYGTPPMYGFHSGSDVCTDLSL